MANRKRKQNISAEELMEQALVPEVERPYEVPENWVWSRLGGVSTLKSGTTLPADKELAIGKVIYLKVADMNLPENQCLINTSSRFIDEYQESYLIPSKSILFPKRGGAILTNKKRMTTQEILVDLNIMAITPKQNVILSYMYYWFLTIDLGTLNNGSNIPQINNKDIEPLYIPIPPITEQQRIVDRIEGLFAKLDQAKELAQNVLNSFEIRKATILHKAFTGELTAKWREEQGIGLDSWERKPIKEYVSKLNQGWSPKCESYPSESVDKWGVIKTTAIQHMDFNELENKQLPLSLTPKQQHELHEGDILITRAGPRIRVGVCCLIKNVRPRLLLCDKAYRFNALREKTLPEFLVYQLNTSMILDEINRMKTGISDSGVNLTQEGFLSIEIVMPSLSEQKEVVRLLDGFLEKEQKVNELTNAIDKIDLMKKAILARAFRGELGTNDTNDESAIELLKKWL